MSNHDRSPGWDKRAINRIARTLYGGLGQMFAMHGWETGGRTFGQIAPTRVVDTYGSVEAFVLSHEDGIGGNAVLDPRVAVAGATPDVWIGEWNAFSPETWGCDSFTKESWREQFMRDSRPGALMVGYVESKGVRRIVGVVQLSHKTGEKWEFISPEEAARERKHHPDEWNFAVKALRAWKVAEDSGITVEQFAPVTYNAKNQNTVSLRGMKLTAHEAMNVLDLPLQEVAVWGQSKANVPATGGNEGFLAASRPGPVSQTGYSVREAEGPKHLYILQLHGDIDAFLGKDAGGDLIVKVGFSVSPLSRLEAHRRALPKGAFEWQLLHSTYAEGAEPYPSSKHALAGEAAMKDFLNTPGKSLGGEFFLASKDSIAVAWSAGKTAAESLRS